MFRTWWQPNTKILLDQHKWARSSDWESAALARRRPRVQIPVGPSLFIITLFVQLVILWIISEGMII